MRGKDSANKPKFRDMEHFIETGPRCPLHIERCIERSKCGWLPHKAKNNGRCGVTRSVALALARCGNDNVPGFKGLWSTYISYESIAAATYFNVDTCMRSVKDLVSTGYLKVRQRPNGTNIYVFDYARLRREGVEGERAAKASRKAALEARKAEIERLRDEMEKDSEGVPGLYSGDALEDDPDDNDVDGEVPTWNDEGVF
jgi:hypothetical protein